MSGEFAWLAEHAREKEKHRGRYIAVVGDEIVASDRDLAVVIAKARPYVKGDRRILISHVSTKELLTT